MSDRNLLATQKERYETQGFLTIENGCMHLVPGSHTRGIVEHVSGRDGYHMANPPSEEDIVPLPLKAGDIFHGDILHYTPRNQTEKRRRALQYHYGSSRCERIKEWELFKLEPEFVVSGKDFSDGVPQGV